MDSIERETETVKHKAKKRHIGTYLLCYNDDRITSIRHKLTYYNIILTDDDDYIIWQNENGERCTEEQYA